MYHLDTAWRYGGKGYVCAHGCGATWESWADYRDDDTACVAAGLDRTAADRYAPIVWEGTPAYV